MNKDAGDIYEGFLDHYKIDDTAPSEYSPPIEEVFPKPETEEEERERLWRAVVTASQI